MKFIFLLPILFCLICNGQPDLQPKYVGGTWIPVRWQNGLVDTYVIRDSLVIILSCVQWKVGDSNVFQAKPGFAIRLGILNRLSASGYAFSARIIYRSVDFEYVSLSPNLPSTIGDASTDKEQMLKVNGRIYRRGFTYTQASRDAILNIVEKMVPELEDGRKPPN